MEQYILLSASALKKLPFESIRELARCADLELKDHEHDHKDGGDHPIATTDDLISQLVCHGVTSYDTAYRAMADQMRSDRDSARQSSRKRERADNNNHTQRRLRSRAADDDDSTVTHTAAAAAVSSKRRKKCNSSASNSASYESGSDQEDTPFKEKYDKAKNASEVPIEPEVSVKKEEIIVKREVKLEETDSEVDVVEVVKVEVIVKEESDTSITMTVDHNSTVDTRTVTPPSHASHPPASEPTAAAAATSNRRNGNFKPTPYEIALWRRRIAEIINLHSLSTLSAATVIKELRYDELELLRTKSPSEIEFVRQFVLDLLADARSDKACESRGESRAKGRNRRSWRGKPHPCPKQAARMNHHHWDDTITEEKREEWIRLIQWALDWNSPVAHTLDDIFYAVQDRCKLPDPKKNPVEYVTLMRLARRMMVESLMGEKKILTQLAESRGREFLFAPALFNDADDRFMCHCDGCHLREESLYPSRPAYRHPSILRPMTLMPRMSKDAYEQYMARMRAEGILRQPFAR